MDTIKVTLDNAPIVVASKITERLQELAKKAEK